MSFFISKIEYRCYIREIARRTSDTLPPTKKCKRNFLLSKYCCYHFKYTIGAKLFSSAEFNESACYQTFNFTCFMNRSEL